MIPVAYMSLLTCKSYSGVAVPIPSEVPQETILASLPFEANPGRYSVTPVPITSSQPPAVVVAIPTLSNREEVSVVEALTLPHLYQSLSVV